MKLKIFEANWMHKMNNLHKWITNLIDYKSVYNCM